MNKKLLAILLLSFVLTGCPEKKPEPETGQAELREKTVPAPELELKKASFSELTGFDKDKIGEAYQAFMLSCKALAKSRSEFLGSTPIKVKTKDFQNICAEAKKIKPEAFRQFITKRFTPYLVVYQGSSEGRFTSYFEPIIHASYTKSEKYQYPIFGRPLDLIEFNPKDFDENLPSRRLVGRVDGQKLVPYHTRSEILSEDYKKAPVILWADNYVDLYVMQIQGPAVAKMEDGSEIRISYADTNGLPFKGIGNILLREKLIEPGQASMGAIKRWLKANLEAAIPHMNENRRFVFHRLINAEGPIGAMGVPVSAGRSLAVDKTFIPLGLPMWLETTFPDRTPLNRLVMAQDIGGAIKGGVRGDYFWGSGGDDILELAGKMNATGRYYLLLPNTVKVNQNEL